jgi:flagellar biosynthesis protein FliP
MSKIFSVSRKRIIILLLLTGICLGILLTLGSNYCYAQKTIEEEGLPTIKLPDIHIGTKDVEDPIQLSLLLHLLFGMTLLSLAPYILVMGTSFIRVTIVLSFLKTALGTQQVPPQQVLMGLALFVTLYIMAPVGEQIHKEALAPYMKTEINLDTMVAKATVPIRAFLLKQTRDTDLLLFIKLAKKDAAAFKNRMDVPIYILMPSYIISEIKTSFEIGFVIYLPFLVIDMVVASVLMSMGMFMLSPMQISMPFKLLLFVMIDGWGLIIENLVKSFE